PEEVVRVRACREVPREQGAVRGQRLRELCGEVPVKSITALRATWDGAGQSAPMDALGRALGRIEVPWPVNLVLLDVAQDLVGDWMREKVRPFYRREGH
ncbi:enhanced serine sensitivity protein SseB C-terminal domain-containing protein, partial [Streptomyces cyaneofuscatus]